LAGFGCYTSETKNSFCMKRLLVFSLAAVCLASPAFVYGVGKGKHKSAKEGNDMPPRRALKLFDTNSNGVTDVGAESEAARKAFETKMNMKHFDTNKDGKLDDTEIAAIKPHGGKGGKGGGKGKKKEAVTA